MTEPDIFEYKNNAHVLIEDLAEAGIERGYIYRRLAFLLCVSEPEAHIGAMTTIRQVKKAVKLLGYMRYKMIAQGRLKRHGTEELFLSGHKKRSAIV